MGIEKKRLIARESVYWFNVNAGIENTVKQCATCIEYQQMQQQERELPYIIPWRPWEVASADIFMVNYKVLLCIVDCYRKFPVVKVISLAVADLVHMAKMVFAEYGLP